MYVHANVCHSSHNRGQKTKLMGSQLFPTTWVPGNELSLSDLAADSFTCWAILPPFSSTFYVTAQPLNVRMNLYQLCGSSTAGYIVCRGVYKIASTRFLICRDLLILQQLLTRLGDAVSTCGKTCKLSNSGELETYLYSVLSTLGAAFQGLYRHQVTRLWRAYCKKKKKKAKRKRNETGLLFSIFVCFDYYCSARCFASCYPKVQCVTPFIVLLP